MPNKNYKRGRAKEYRIRDKLLSEGYQIVQRTAGSHSCIDIIAIDTIGKSILLVQAKPNDFSEKKKNEILEDLKELNDHYKVEFKII